MTGKLIFGLMLLLALCSAPSLPDTRGHPEYEIKAAYLYNFLLFIEWPSEAFRTPPPSPINICILGDDPFRQLLTPVLKRTAQQRRVLVHYLEKYDTRRHCHVLFISASEQQHLQELLRQMRSSHSLTVADIPGFARQGGMIGFVREQDRVRLEINMDAMQSSGLKASSKLLEVAVSIVGR